MTGKTKRLFVLVAFNLGAILICAFFVFDRPAEARKEQPKSIDSDNPEKLRREMVIHFLKAFFTHDWESAIQYIERESLVDFQEGWLQELKRGNEVTLMREELPYLTQSANRDATPEKFFIDYMKKRAKKISAEVLEQRNRTLQFGIRDVRKERESVIHYIVKGQWERRDQNGQIRKGEFNIYVSLCRHPLKEWQVSMRHGVPSLD